MGFIGGVKIGDDGNEKMVKRGRRGEKEGLGGFYLRERGIKILYKVIKIESQVYNMGQDYKLRGRS